ncbi:MAG: hypothetical protein WCS37_06285 [Chloroflexota bacterium]|nr:hypothetical protein [Chloroflexota bacterium]
MAYAKRPVYDQSTTSLQPLLMEKIRFNLNHPFKTDQTVTERNSFGEV